MQMSQLFLSSKNGCLAVCPILEATIHVSTWPRNIMDGACSRIIIQSHTFHRFSRHLSWNRWRWRGGIRDTIIIVKGDTTPGKHRVSECWWLMAGVSQSEGITLKPVTPLRCGEESPRIHEEFTSRHVGQSIFRNMATICNNQPQSHSNRKLVPNNHLSSPASPKYEILVWNGVQYHGKSQVSLSPCCSPSFAFLGVSAIPSLQRWATVHLTPAKPGCKEKLPYIYIYIICVIYVYVFVCMCVPFMYCTYFLGVSLCFHQPNSWNKSVL